MYIYNTHIYIYTSLGLQQDRTGRVDTAAWKGRTKKGFTGSTGIITMMMMMLIMMTMIYRDNLPL